MSSDSFLAFCQDCFDERAPKGLGLEEARLLGVQVDLKQSMVLLRLQVVKLLHGPELLEVERFIERTFSLSQAICAQSTEQCLNDTEREAFFASLAPWFKRHALATQRVEAEFLSSSRLEATPEGGCFYLSKGYWEHLQSLSVIWPQAFFDAYGPFKADFHLAACSEMTEASSQRMEAIEASVQAEVQDRAQREEKRQADLKKDQGALVWGKRPRRVVLREIPSLDKEMKQVSIAGNPFAIHYRSFRQRGCLSFCIEDQQRAIKALIWLKKEEGEALAKRLASGRFRFTGSLIWEPEREQGYELSVTGIEAIPCLPIREDTAKEKRVEFHLHTRFSARDAMSAPADVIRRAAHFGHPAVALTDHGVVQAFPEAAATKAALEREGTQIKIIYGMEGYLHDDGPVAVFGLNQAHLEAHQDLVLLASEGDGEKALRLEAIRYAQAENYEASGRFAFDLTAIAEDADSRRKALKELEAFLDGASLYGPSIFQSLEAMRQAGFALPHDSERVKFLHPVIDMEALSRYSASKQLLEPLQGLESFDDHVAVLPLLKERFLDFLAARSMDGWLGLNQELGALDFEARRKAKQRARHIIVLAKNYLGLYHLYRLVSAAHLEHFYRSPIMPRSLLQYLGGGLLFGSACCVGEVFLGVQELYFKLRGAPEEELFEALQASELVETARFYDYLEIQPRDNNSFMVGDPRFPIEDRKELALLNRLVVALGDLVDRPVLATCDAHFIDEEEAIFRTVMQSSMKFNNEFEVPLYLRTTDEMLEEFAYLGEAKAYEVVVQNTKAMAARVEEDLQPFPSGFFPPVLERADERLTESCQKEAQRLYGQQGRLPALIKERMDMELSAIIDNGYASLYLMSQDLVAKSNADGYIVGSRGSVGSSLVAFLCQITEVNPLAPHYRCPDCAHFVLGEEGAYGSGFDLPDKACPSCQTPMIKDGQDIPFATFLGFQGDKVPDIDLNFSGYYQAQAHAYVEEQFGTDYTYRAGTISSYAEKNSLGIVRNYCEEHDLSFSFADMSRLAHGLHGVKSSTGQHPGGLVVLPKDREIYDFTPVQYPANKRESGVITTHFDFNALDGTILKLDILGHDDPSMQRMLTDLTGVDVRSIPIPEEKVMSLFCSSEALGIPMAKSPSKSGTLGLPEVGTMMAREMSQDTDPSSFYDLVQLSGLSHGEQVWQGNAQELILGKVCSLKDVIGCRDNIMTKLIQAGMDSSAAFQVMESVRKGRGLSEEQKELMRAHQIPEWYIGSCEKIKYLFPKAHAVAYTISTLRIAWFKVYHPEAYYCTWLTIRADEFNCEDFCLPLAQLARQRKDQAPQIRQKSKTDQRKFLILEVVEEMLMRGIHFLPVSLEESTAEVFVSPEAGSIRPPLNAVPGISSSMAQRMVRARQDAPFKNWDDIRHRAGLGPAAIESLRLAGVLEGLPESAQIDLFSMV